MSLLSIDITKVKRLPLRGVRLPAPEVREPEKPITGEDIDYSKLVAKNPLIEKLVNSLDLVSIKTGERLRNVDIKEEVRPQEPVDSSKLLALTKKIIEPENSYSKEDIIARIQEETKVSQERAETGFNLILQTGAIEPLPGGRYCLKGSTPF